MDAVGADLRELIIDLEARFPGFRERLLDGSGDLRRFVNIYVGEENVRFLDGLSTAIPAGVTVSIIPAVAGGCEPMAGEGLTPGSYRWELVQRLRNFRIDSRSNILRPALLAEAAHEIERLDEEARTLRRTHGDSMADR